MFQMVLNGFGIAVSLLFLYLMSNILMYYHLPEGRSVVRVYVRKDVAHFAC